MSLPSLDQYRQGATTWKGTHKGVSYTLSHHGVSDYSPKGTWCFYIHILEPMFIEDGVFALFDREPEITEISKGSYWETYPYSDVPDYGFHGGITFYNRDYYIDKEGRKQKAIKMGCDYAHSWDRDGGYYEGYDEVLRDAHQFIDKLIEAHPIKPKCGYSGKIGMPEEFYKAKNGNWIHKSYLEKLTADGWDGWLPEAEQAA